MLVQLTCVLRGNNTVIFMPIVSQTSYEEDVTTIFMYNRQERMKHEIMPTQKYSYLAKFSALTKNLSSQLSKKKTKKNKTKSNKILSNAQSIEFNRTRLGLVICRGDNQVS